MDGAENKPILTCCHRLIISREMLKRWLASGTGPREAGVHGTLGLHSRRTGVHSQDICNDRHFMI